MMSIDVPVLPHLKSVFWKEEPRPQGSSKKDSVQTFHRDSCPRPAWNDIFLCSGCFRTGRESPEEITYAPGTGEVTGERSRVSPPQAAVGICAPQRTGCCTGLSGHPPSWPSGGTWTRNSLRCLLSTDISGSWDLSSGPPRNQKLTEDEILPLQVLCFLPLANETHIICHLFSPFLWAADCQTQRTLKRDTLPEFRQRPLGWGSQRQDVFWGARAALGLLPQQVRGQGLTAQKLPPHRGLAAKVATADIFPASLAWSRPHLSPPLVPVPLSSSSHPCGPQTCRVATEPVQGHLGNQSRGETQPRALRGAWRGPALCPPLTPERRPAVGSQRTLRSTSGQPTTQGQRPNERRLFMVTTVDSELL